MIITIDGPSGSGKGTVALRLARKLGFALLDSGSIYRVLAYQLLSAERDLTDEITVATYAQALDLRFEPTAGGVDIYLAGNLLAVQQIRTEAVGQAASQVAKLPLVREALLARQQAFAEPFSEAAKRGLIADGRDMGTVVFPEAALKIFLVASAKERARRRYEQLLSSGIDASMCEILEMIEARDEQDRNRPIAPLKPAFDAITIDSTTLSIEDVFDQILSLASPFLK